MIALTAFGILTPLGHDAELVVARLDRGESAVRPHEPLSNLPCSGAGVVDGPDLLGWLKRKKDQKLLPRAAMLAIPVVGRLIASCGDERENLGFFTGVGREPPDEGDSEACLAASARDGRLDTARLSTEGVALYPPLLPLKSLPNMAMAHVAMLFGIRGPNDAVTGESGAGMCALIEACNAIADGLATVCLAGGADSRVDLGSARDLYRLGRASAQRPPGEGAVFFVLQDREPGDPEVLGWIRAHGREPSRGVEPRAHWALTGDLGTADGLFELAMAVARRRPATVTASDDQGARAHVVYEPTLPVLGSA